MRYAITRLPPSSDYFPAPCADWYSCLCPCDMANIPMRKVLAPDFQVFYHLNWIDPLTRNYQVNSCAFSLDSGYNSLIPVFVVYNFLLNHFHSISIGGLAFLPFTVCLAWRYFSDDDFPKDTHISPTLNLNKTRFNNEITRTI